MTHHEMRRAVVQFAFTNRHKPDVFLENLQPRNIAEMIGGDCNSRHGNQQIVGGGVFHNVDEYFQACDHTCTIGCRETDAHLQIMSQDGAWGQHYELMAAAALFGVYIVVHQPGRYEECAAFGDRMCPHIFLQLLEECHYQWQRPQRD